MASSTTNRMAVADVAAMLVEMDKVAYIPAFMENQVDGKLLVRIDDDMLKDDLGVSNRLHRRRLLDKVQEMTQVQVPNADAEHDVPSENATNAPRTLSSIVYATFAPGMGNGVAYAPVDPASVVACDRGNVQDGGPCIHPANAPGRFCTNHTCIQTGCFNTKSSSDVACDRHGARFYLFVDQMFA
jgi:hypothetical protein